MIRRGGGIGLASNSGQVLDFGHYPVQIVEQRLEPMGHAPKTIFLTNER